MEQFIREGNAIYIGGNPNDAETSDGVNISHVGGWMSPGEHTMVVAQCFGFQFFIFKGTNAFEKIYPKFIEWQEKLYNCSKTEDRREYKTIHYAAEIDLENLTIGIVIHYVSPDEIRRYIANEKEKSYDEGYNEHKRQLREIFGFSKR